MSLTLSRSRYPGRSKPYRFGTLPSRRPRRFGGATLESWVVLVVWGAVLVLAAAALGAELARRVQP